MQGQGTSVHQPAVDHGETSGAGGIPENAPVRTAPDDAALIPMVLLDLALESASIPAPAEASADPITAAPDAADQSPESHPLFQTFVAPVPEPEHKPETHHATIETTDGHIAAAHPALLIADDGDNTLDAAVGALGADQHALLLESRNPVLHPESETSTPIGGSASIDSVSRASMAETSGSVEILKTSGGGDVTAISSAAHQHAGVGNEGAPTGNIYLDTLIDGSRWIGGPILYCFATSDPYPGGLNTALGINVSGGDAWNQTDKDAFAAALQQYENVCGLTFQETTTPTDANILWFKEPDSAMDGALGIDSFPDNFTPVVYGAFNDDPSDWDATKLTPGGDAFDTIIHELGHGMGLAHPHDGGGLPGSTIFPGATAFGVGQFGLNQSVFTVMSYNPGWNGQPSHTLDYGQPKSLMAFDIAALQILYGTVAHNTGSDTYTLPTANGQGTGWTCIWDTGGTDTIDGGAATKAVTIDLEAAPLTGEHAGGYISWESGISGGFTIANGVVIDNAIGGSAADKLTGNDNDNAINGGDGNDTISGLGGSDTLDGGKGDDTLDGGTGADDMTGGAGNDLFLVDDAGDTVTENVGEGTDTIKSSVDFDLSKHGANVETLILLDGATNGTGDGNANTITGNAADNTLDGGGGGDKLTGGLGNDTYLVDDAGDKVIEAAGKNAGTEDKIESSVSFSLANAANVEQLQLTGTDDIDGTGGKGNDSIIGNTGKNTLDGSDGNDVLTDSSLLSGGGDDTLRGGKGTDNLSDDTGNNTLDGGDGDDTINASSATGDDQITGGAGNDTIDDFGGTNTIDGGAGIDTITTHGSGNDTITGGDGDDIITDGGGTNSIDGGKGNDRIQVGGTSTVHGGDGNDDMSSFSSGASTLFGEAGNDTMQSQNKLDTLDGGDGNDSLSSVVGGTTLIGGKGNDSYSVHDGKETIIEKAGEGIDTVTTFVSLDFTKGSLATADIENIKFVSPDLKIVGNGLDNVITDVSHLGSSGDQLFGGGGNDTLVGGSAGDTLDGGTGNDTMTGGGGSDTYVVDSLTDKIIETAAGGNADTVMSATTYSLAALQFVENLTLTGKATGTTADTDAINGTGNVLDNTLTGNAGNNLLDGGAGNDTFIGGKGDDTFVLDNVAELDGAHVQENSAEGSDTIKTALQLTGPFAGIANVENYVNTGTKAWDVDLSGKTGVAHILVGGSADDKLTGSDQGDTLDGGKGSDTLVGGKGDDTYVVDSLKDIVTEDAGAGSGTDTVKTAVLIADSSNFANVENFTYTGTSAWTFTGNDDDNVITGGTGADKLNGGKGNDTLFGNDGNDTLDGGAGNDAMNGGKGNDVYTVDSANDFVFENKGEGTDLVKSTVNIDLTGKQFQGEIENVTLVQDDANNLFPNKVVGNEFNNIIIGVDGHNGIGMTFSGGGGNDTLVGGALNDTLDGGTGNDTMTGGLGSDIYIVDSVGDKVVETSNTKSPPGVIDTVRSEISFSLASLKFVENVTLTGTNKHDSTDTDAINATGNDLVNTLTGNDGDNVLDGGKGIDNYIGGKGNDTFIVDDAGELANIFNFGTSGEGSDTIKTALQLGGTGGVGGPGAFTGIAGVENYVNTGAKAWNVDLSGAIGVSHTLTGSSAADTLVGSDSGNYLDGGKSNDTLTGGSGADTFVIDSAGDTILGVIDATDTLLVNHTFDLTTDAQFGGMFENAGLTGTAALNITGNNDVNNLFGNDGANLIDGGGGGDAMAGGKGNDTYLVDDPGDTVTENPGGGIDTIKSTDVNIDLTGGNFTGEIENVTILGTASSVTGNDLNNVIIGNDSVNNFVIGGKGNDTLTGGSKDDDLDGGTGNDTMTGGKGDDIYHVDSPTDKIVETLTFAAGGGTDTVVSAISYSVAALANIDNLTLTTDGTGHDTVALNGTGNALSNTITGNDGDNILDGGKGDDTLIGGDGNDTYIFDSAGDKVGGDTGGHDTLMTSVSTLENDAKLTDIEDFIATGTGAITLGGNDLDNHIVGNSAHNVLTGALGADILDGGKGADDLSGGDGNDTYVVDNIKDTVTENLGEGTHDLVQSSLTYTLGDNVEDLTLTGTAAINGTGNDANNIITGNDGKNVLQGLVGDDTLVGGKGEDTLTGGGGKDTFAYHAADLDTSHDTITDFSKSDGDVLDIGDLFTGPGPSDLAHAVSDGYLLLFNNPVTHDTVVAVNADGVGNDFVWVATVKGVELTDTDTANISVT